MFLRQDYPRMLRNRIEAKKSSGERIRAVEERLRLLETDGRTGTEAYYSCVRNLKDLKTEMIEHDQEIANYERALRLMNGGATIDGEVKKEEH